jgi:hypothetical protein
MQPVLARVLALTGPYLQHRDHDRAPRGQRQVCVEWQARLVISLVTTPSVTTSLDEPRKLRRYTSDLLDIGLAPVPDPVSAAQRSARG